MIQPLIDTNLPVFGTSEPPEKVLTFVRHNIVKLLAPSCSMHGVFMDVFGMGILLSGQSGIGKSELGLELVTRGHGLVADDVVDFIQRAPDWVEGSAPALWQISLKFAESACWISKRFSERLQCAERCV